MNLPAETLPADLLTQTTDLLAKRSAPASVADIQKELNVAKADAARLKADLAAAAEAGKIANWGSPTSPKYWSLGPVDYFTPKVLDALSEGPQTVVAVQTKLKNIPGSMPPPAGTVGEILSKLKGEERAFVWGDSKSAPYGLKDPGRQCEEALLQAAARGPVPQKGIPDLLKAEIGVAIPKPIYAQVVDSLQKSGQLHLHSDKTLRRDAPRDPREQCEEALLSLAANGPLPKNKAAEQVKTALGFAPPKAALTEAIDALLSSNRLYLHTDKTLRRDAPRDPRQQCEETLLSLAANGPLAKAKAAEQVKTALGFAPPKAALTEAIDALIASNRLYLHTDKTLRLDAPRDPREQCEEALLNLIASGPIAKNKAAAQVKAALGFAPPKDALLAAIESLQSSNRLFLHPDGSLHRDAFLDAPGIAAKLEAMLMNLKQMAPESYPPTLGYLLSRMELKLTDKLTVQALTLASERLAIPFLKPTSDTLLSLWDDRGQLLQSPAFLQQVFTAARKGSANPLLATKLGTAVAPKLRADFETALQQALDQQSMPKNVCWFLDGNQIKLLDLSDLRPRSGAAPLSPKPAATPAEVADTEAVNESTANLA